VHPTVFGPRQAIVSERGVQEVAEQTLQGRAVVSGHPPGGVKIEAARMLIVGELGEVGGHREGPRDPWRERHSGLLTEEADPVDRRLGAVEQERLLVDDGGIVESHGVRVLLPVAAEGLQLAFRLGVGARGDLAPIVSGGRRQGPELEGSLLCGGRVDEDPIDEGPMNVKLEIQRRA